MGIGINGMGRIGRLLVRKCFERGRPELPITAINCSYPAETIAHLLRYDSVHGRWNTDLAACGDELRINGHSIRIINQRDPQLLPWKELGVALVLDATGKFNERQAAEAHLISGAQQVIVTAPGENMDLTVVMGVNDHLYDRNSHKLMSAASCTTNCVAPVLDVLDCTFGIRSGWVTTVHSFTSDQNHLDNPHKDLRRARACTQSIIPTTTGVGKALSGVLPHLAPYIQGIALRVPTQDVSLIDVTVTVSRKANADEVNAAFKQAAYGVLAPYLDFSEEPLVSVDFVGSSYSAIIDGPSTIANGTEIKVLAWYDNEWGYACRVIDFAKLVFDNSVPAWQKELVQGGRRS
jgi:glyceraldehyde 3-phosphate dehydrogenase